MQKYSVQLNTAQVLSLKDTVHLHGDFVEEGWIQHFWNCKAGIYYKIIALIDLKSCLLGMLAVAPLGPWCTDWAIEVAPPVTG